MLVFLVIQTVFAAVFVKHLDVPLALSGMLGIFLVLCAYSAIGLFMSVLTSYQLVAAIGTLLVLSALNFIGMLWQDIPVAREITWWLSISGRAKTFLSGLISSEDVVYFLVLIVFGIVCVEIAIGTAALFFGVAGCALWRSGMCGLGVRLSDFKTVVYALL